MHIPVNEITIRTSQNGIKPDSFRDYRILDISFKHLSSPCLASFVHLMFEMSGVVFQGLTLSHSEKILCLRLRYYSRVSPHRIGLGIMSFKKHLQLTHPDEIRRIGDDGGQECLIPLIAFQLSLPVSGSRYI